MKPADAMTEETRVKLLSELLLSQPWVLVSCGLGQIKGEKLAKQLLKLTHHTASSAVEGEKA